MCKGESGSHVWGDEEARVMEGTWDIISSSSSSSSSSFSIISIEYEPMAIQCPMSSTFL
jgi:hypothetical protein